MGWRLVAKAVHTARPQLLGGWRLVVGGLVVGGKGCAHGKAAAGWLLAVGGFTVMARALHTARLQLVVGGMQWAWWLGVGGLCEDSCAQLGLSREVEGLEACKGWGGWWSMAGGWWLVEGLEACPGCGGHTSLYLHAPVHALPPAAVCMCPCVCVRVCVCAHVCVCHYAGEPRMTTPRVLHVTHCAHLQASMTTPRVLLVYASCRQAWELTPLPAPVCVCVPQAWMSCSVCR